MAQAYKHTNTSVYALQYHIVWCPKRRRKILVGDVESRLKALLVSQCQENGWDVLALEVMPDHLHLFVSAPPTVSLAQLIHQLKGHTSRVLRREFPALIRLPALWTRSFFATTAGSVSKQTIEWYVGAQKTRDATEGEKK